MPDTFQFDQSMHAALAAVRAGRLAVARGILEGVARSSPLNDGFFEFYLDVVQAQGDWPALELAAKRWQQYRPEHPRVFEAQAMAAWESGRFHHALELYRRVLALAGRDASRVATYARLCLKALEFDQAARALDEAERIAPDNVHMLSGQALLRMFYGRFDEAETYCRRALARDPQDVTAYGILGKLKSGLLSEGERAQLASLSAQPGRRLEERISAAFCLGDCLDARGEFAQAFAAYGQANSLAEQRGRAESLSYDPEAAVRSTDQLIAEFATLPHAPPGAVTTGQPRPLFIIGMPRSGTTLIESVLGAHSRVFACGERMALRPIRREYLRLAAQSRNVQAQQRADLARSYFDQLPDVRGAACITDKNPWNFDAVGVILALFPAAHIIHVRRDPVETALSIFCHDFPKFQAFTQRLDHIGHYYGQYARLMAHWEQLAGPRMTTIQYEDFVADFSGGAPALVHACALEWEEGCAHFQSSKRPVATLSTVQARQPVKAGSSRARRYGGLLIAPLLQALSTAGVEHLPVPDRPS